MSYSKNLHHFIDKWCRLYSKTNIYIITCSCTPPCTLSSVSFLCLKPCRLSCRLPVCKAECRWCGSPAGFSGLLSAGMPLPCPSAIHRHRQTVAVFPTTFRAGPTTCRNSSGTFLPTRGPFLRFHYSYAFDIGLYIILETRSNGLAFPAGFLTFVLHVSDYPLYIIRTVVSPVPDFGKGKRPVIP